MMSVEQEIKRYGKKLKKSIEYTELTGVFYMKTGQFKQALNTFLKIRYGKREFSMHQKIIQCYIKLNRVDECLKYIAKKIHLSCRLFCILDKKVNRKDTDLDNTGRRERTIEVERIDIPFFFHY